MSIVRLFNDSMIRCRHHALEVWDGTTALHRLHDSSDNIGSNSTEEPAAPRCFDLCCALVPSVSHPAFAGSRPLLLGRSSTVRGALLRFGKMGDGAMGDGHVPCPMASSLQVVIRGAAASQCRGQS
jgi:hypothetical protein